MENFIVEIKERLNKEGVKTSGSVKISEDGSTLICGYPVEECAIIFTKQEGRWVIQQKLTVSDGAANDLFGISVSISSDGNTALVGAHRKSSYTGAAYIFTRSGSTWTQQQKLVASDGAASDWFGWSVSLSLLMVTQLLSVLPMLILVVLTQVQPMSSLAQGLAGLKNRNLQLVILLNIAFLGLP